MSKSTEKRNSSGLFEEPKLGNARRLRGIHFINPEDEEYKETNRNARPKLEIPMEAAMLCKNGNEGAP